MFFQKILLSNANNESIPTKYAKNSNIIPKKSIENSNQKEYKFTKIPGVKLYTENK
jgi:hypothetical protein